MATRKRTWLDYYFGPWVLRLLGIEYPERPVLELIAGDGMTIDIVDDDATDASKVTFSSTGGTGGGEANTVTNVGSGAGLAKTKSGVNIPLKSLVAGANITLTQNANDVTIAATGGGSGSASVGSSGQVNTSDGAGGWLAPSNVFAGANFVAIGATPAGTGRLRVPYSLPYDCYIANKDSGGVDRAVLGCAAAAITLGDYATHDVYLGGQSVVANTAIQYAVYVGGVAKSAFGANEQRHATPRLGLNAPFASEGRSLITAAPPHTLSAAEYSYAETAFADASAGTYTFPTLSAYEQVNFKWLTNLSATTKTITNGGATTYSLAAGEQAWIKFSPDGVFGPPTVSGEANTMSSAGGTASVYKTKTGVDLILRGISVDSANTPLTIAQNTNDITIGWTNGSQGQFVRSTGAATVWGNRASHIELAADASTVSTVGLIRIPYNAGLVTIAGMKDSGGTDRGVWYSYGNAVIFGEYGQLSAALNGTDVDIHGSSQVTTSIATVVKNYITASLEQTGVPRVGLNAPYSSDGRVTITTGTTTLSAAQYSRHKIVVNNSSAGTYTFPHPASEDASYFKLFENDAASTYAVSVATGTGVTVSINAGDRRLLEFTPSGVRLAVN